jgi:hypothetical protein
MWPDRRESRYRVEAQKLLRRRAAGRLSHWTRSRRPYWRLPGFRNERQTVTSGVAFTGRPRVMPIFRARLRRSAGDLGSLSA